MLCETRATIGEQKYDLTLKTGYTRDGDWVLRGLARKTKRFEPIDARCFDMAVMQGAYIREWTQVAMLNAGSKARWKDIRENMMRGRVSRKHTRLPC